MNIEQQIADYKPYNEQEAHDQAVMRRFLPHSRFIFTRENEVAHMTASSWLLNATHDKVLMIYHNIYHSWAWTGGHADGDRDLLAVAKREAMEETGVTEIRAISEDIFSLEILTVDGHEKRGVYVPSHLHLNVSYLLEADEEEVLRIKPDENSGVRWFSMEEALAACSEPWMIERVYKKAECKSAGAFRRDVRDAERRMTVKDLGTKRLETERLILRRFTLEDAEKCMRTGRAILRSQSF